MRAALPLLLVFACGCTPEAGPCVATVDDDVNTVLHVEWSTPKPGRSWVEFGVDGELDRATDVVDDPEATDHAARLLMLPSLTDVTWEAVTERNGKQWRCAGVTRTRNLPTGLTDIEVTLSEPADHDPATPHFLGLTFGESSMVFVIDRDGEVLWYRAIDPLLRLPADVQPAADGHGLLYNDFPVDRVDSEDIYIHRVDWDGAETEAIQTPYAHHMFAQHSDGTLAWQGLDIRDVEGIERPIIGDAVIERGADGAETTVWTGWDTIPFPESRDWENEYSFYPQGADWTHGNALHEHPLDPNRWVVSLRNVRSVVEIDRTSGEIVEAYGELGVREAEGERFFVGQHDVQVLPDGHLLMFMTDVLVNRSGAIEYEVADDGLREVWSHGYDDHYLSSSLGQARRLGNGNTFVNFGNNGMLREVTPDGRIVWEAHTYSSTWFHQVVPLDAHALR